MTEEICPSCHQNFEICMDCGRPILTGLINSKNKPERFKPKFYPEILDESRDCFKCGNKMKVGDKIYKKVVELEGIKEPAISYFCMDCIVKYRGNEL